MKKQTHSPDTTTITAMPTTVRLTKDVQMEAEIIDLKRELMDGMYSMDTQTKHITLLDEQIGVLYKALAQQDAKALKAQKKAEAEIKVLKTALKFYL